MAVRSTALDLHSYADKMAALFRKMVHLATRIFIFTMTCMIGITQANENNSSKLIVSEFFVAVTENNIGKLKQYIAQGVPVDSRDTDGRTALLLATHANAIDAARILIETGADVNAKDDINDSPYLYAGAHGRLQILKMTIAAGADLGSVNRYGGTALIPAAHHGHVEVVRYLLTTGIDINHVNNLGWTALLEAVILGDGGPVYQQIVKLLLQAGADRTIGDKQGITALEHAKSTGQTEIVKLFEK